MDTVVDRAGDERKKTMMFLLKWLVISIIVGSTGALMVYGFSYVLRKVILFLPSDYVFLWPVVGAAVVGWGCYRIAPDARGDGTSSYIIGVNDHSGYLGPVATALKVLATILTLGFYSSGGMVGTLGRINAGLGSAVGGGLMKLGFTADERRTASICGMAATVSGLLISPIGGGIFAVEVLKRRSMRYVDLFPAILASSISFIVVKLLRYQPFYTIAAPSHSFDPELFGPILITIVFSAVVGFLFMKVFDGIAGLFEKTGWSWSLKSFIGGAAVCVIGLIFTRKVLGPGTELFDMLMHGTEHQVGTGAALWLLFLIAGKIISTSMTVGSGLSGGLFAPCMLLGIMSGAAVANMLGTAAGTESYFILTAVGVAAMLSGVMNVPISGAVIVMELYGIDYAVPAALASVIVFQLLRTTTIYAYAIEHIAGISDTSSSYK